MLRSEVDDTKLDQASPALRREPETVWTAFLVAVGSRILDGQQETDWCCRRVVFHRTDSADLPSGCRASQHRVFKKHLININSVPPSRALTGTIRRAALLETAGIFKKTKNKKYSLYKTEKRDTGARPPCRCLQVTSTLLFLL